MIASGELISDCCITTFFVISCMTALASKQEHQKGAHRQLPILGQNRGRRFRSLQVKDRDIAVAAVSLGA